MMGEIISSFMFWLYVLLSITTAGFVAAVIIMANGVSEIKMTRGEKVSGVFLVLISIPLWPIFAAGIVYNLCKGEVRDGNNTPD